ncbi:MAG: hypothetical protein GY795_44930 [Desulfobacterales bacterium]|nr:hypothetical protein [Desulfobacterales bacterium]
MKYANSPRRADVKTQLSPISLNNKFGKYQLSPKNTLSAPRPARYCADPTGKKIFCSGFRKTSEIKKIHFPEILFSKLKNPFPRKFSPKMCAFGEPSRF